jgi:hypothetical protein
MTALQDYLRTAIFGGKSKNDDDATQYGLRILDRAGFTGMASPFFNALYGLKYHRSISQSLQGSVLGRAGQAVDATGGLFIGNSDNTNTAERKAAGLLYDLVIDPAARTRSVRSTCAGQRDSGNHGDRQQGGRRASGRPGRVRRRRCGTGERRSRGASVGVRDGRGAE